MFGTLWMVITLPIRLVAWVVGLVGRMTALAVGFVLMVMGVALGAGPLFPIGIPLFVLGLVLSLRALG